MHRNAVPPVGRGEVGLDVGFHVLPGGRTCNIQQVQHKLGDGVGLAEVWRLDVRRIQRGHDVVPIPMLGLEGVGGPAQFKPVAEKVMHHVHAPALPVLQHHDSHAGWRHPRDEAFQGRQPVFWRNVIERVGAEDEIALDSRLSGQDRQANRFGSRERLLQLVSEIDVRLDGNGARKGPGKRFGHFPIPRACVDEDSTRRQSIDHLLQPSLGVPLLIRVVEEDLKGLFVGLSLGVKHADAFLVRHAAPSPWQWLQRSRAPVYALAGRLCRQRGTGPLWGEPSALPVSCMVFVSSSSFLAALGQNGGQADALPCCTRKDLVPSHP